MILLKLIHRVTRRPAWKLGDISPKILAYWCLLGDYAHRGVVDWTFSKRASWVAPRS